MRRRQPDHTKKRLKVLSIILILVIIIFTVRMVDIQIVDANTYLNQLNGISVRTSIIKASRGEILDRYGRQIAYNREGYNINFNYAYLKKDKINSTLSALFPLLEDHSQGWTDTLPLNIDAPYDFIDNESQVNQLKSKLGLAHYASASDCFTQLVKKYSLEGLDPKIQRKIMGVRYSMDISDFSIANPFTFAEDISSELMLIVKESGFMLNGVSVDVAQFREYADSTFAPHIIGTVGPIQNWEDYKDKGYSYNDKVGTSGIEKSAEEHLHGTDGIITYKIDAKGNILSYEVTTEPIAGKTVMLTLDKSLQLAAQDALKTEVTALRNLHGTATGAAIVGIDINNGGVVLSATYPSYDINDYYNNYKVIEQTAHNPLINRAFNGIYPLGSSIKPAVAIAALETNKITSDEYIKCTQRYTFYADYQPSCMHYHGQIGLISAISRSCNFYFFEAGRRLGINTLNKYLADFGFGSKTGVEVADSEGILAGPDEDGNWIGGDTLRVAIGQMDAFTPIQLANYTATIANGGTRYKTTLIDKIVSYDQNTVEYKNTGTEVVKIDISDSTLNTVKAGMLSVTEDGTGSAAFKNYPIKVGGKTGTAQTTGADHSVFIAFAPYENPEIAVSIIIEHGASSAATTKIVRSVFDAYFFSAPTEPDLDIPYTVLE
ncbi:MAG: hypothetical protein IJN65_00955 [Clostridia bacterium]|nr:hypothetical protein [Clostridia bacterium]